MAQQQSGRAPAKYRQIADDLRDRIGSGEYPVGTQLPTKNALAETHEAAIGTVDEALAVLRKLGLVETRQGAGTFVLRQEPGASETQELGEQVADLRAALAELSKRVEVSEDAGLREIVSRIEGNLIELYGKTGFDYPAGEADTQRQDRRARHG